MDRGELFTVPNGYHLLACYASFGSRSYDDKGKRNQTNMLSLFKLALFKMYMYNCTLGQNLKT